MSHEDFDLYGDGGEIKSAHASVPRWLIYCYIILPIWGVIWFALYWNGLSGWLDRGYWHELEKAALTTFPVISESKTEEKIDIQLDRTQGEKR